MQSRVQRPRAPTLEHAWTVAEAAVGRLWLELAVKREGGSKGGQMSVVVVGNLVEHCSHSKDFGFYLEFFGDSLD